MGPSLNLQYPGASITVAGGIDSSGDIDGTYVDSTGLNQIFLRHADGTYTTIPEATFSVPFIPSLYLEDAVITNVGGLNDSGQFGVQLFSQNAGVHSPIYYVQDTGGNFLFALNNPENVDPNQHPVALNNNGYLLISDVFYGNFADSASLNTEQNSGLFVQVGVNTSSINNNNVMSGWGFGGLDFSQYRKFGSAPGDQYSPSLVCSNYPTTSTHLYALNDSNVGAGLLLPSAGSSVAFIATLTGTIPNLQLSRTSLNFGNLAIGEVSQVQTVSVTNTGSGTLHIPNFPAFTELTDQFSIAQTTCGPPLAPGSSCSISVQFTPTMGGALSDGITLVDDSPTGPHTINLFGYAGPSVLQLSNTSWHFAHHPIGQTSGNGKIYIYNEGPIRDTTTGFTITGVNASDFKILATTCGSIFNAYRTCSVTFDFTPSAIGVRSATLNLNDNSVNGPIQIPIAGDGIPD